MEDQHKNQSHEKGQNPSKRHDEVEQIPVSFIGGDNVDGDKITMGDVVGQSAVATGRGARASILNIDIRLLPLVLGLLVLVAILGYFLLRPEPKPEVMDAEFNVAVAEFVVEDGNGKQIQSDEGKKFASWLYGRVYKGLTEVLAELYDGTHLVWPPEYTGTISGEGPEEREKNAAERARSIQADVIIYGVLVPEEDKSQTSIEFYVNHDSFDEGADIKGGHRLGNPVPIDNPFVEALVSVENIPLSARAKGLSLLTIGLAYYSIDEFEKALTYFELADADQQWLDSERTGKHVLKLLVGNTYVRQASKLRQPELLPTARAYYTSALDLDKEYARAAVGLAGIDYLLAIPNPDDPESRLDPELLDRAEKGFEEALTLEHIPPTANVPNKVDLYLGQIYLVRYATVGGDWIEMAVEKFDAVIEDYEGGNEQIEDLASHAYARKGLIEDKINNQPQAAIELYKKAVDLSSPYYRGEYYGRLGDLYVETCQFDLAEEAYQQAVDAAYDNADSKKYDEYGDKLDDLQIEQTCP